MKGYNSLFIVSILLFFAFAFVMMSYSILNNQLITAVIWCSVGCLVALCVHFKAKEEKRLR